MGRVISFAYGVVSYAIFFATFLYALGFVGNLIVPKSMDSAPQMPFWPALAINLGNLVIVNVIARLVRKVRGET